MANEIQCPTLITDGGGDFASLNQRLFDLLVCEKKLVPVSNFSKLAEGTMVCIMEAPDERALSTWFQKMQMPCDSITPVELE